MNMFVGLLIAFFFFVVVGALLDKNRRDNENSSTQNDSDNYGGTAEDLNKVLYSSNKPKNSDVVYIVGGFYRSWEAKQYIKKLYPCETVFLKDEPDNPYDHNAIMVLSKNGLHIGYVSRADIPKVKGKMTSGPVKGSIYETIDSRYEYQILVVPMPDDEEYNNALNLYNERKRKEADAQKVYKLRSELDFYSVVGLARDFVSSKRYASIYKMLKPIFDADVQDEECYLLMINSCHYIADYESELQYIDKYIESGKVKDREFINRRKYQVLRLLGHLVSNDQIENEKAGVETTILELDFFNRIVSLLSDVVDPNRIDFRDAKSLFAVNLDSNMRRPICKLYLNNPDKMFIGLINDDASVLKVQIKDISELDDLKDDLLKPINKFLNNVQ